MENKVTGALGEASLCIWSCSVPAQLLSPGQLFATLWMVAHQAPLPWESPGENTGVGCHTLFQRIFISLVSCIAGGFFTTEPPWVWRGCNKTPHPLIYGHPLGRLACILMGVHLIYRERSCRYPESSLKICSLLGTRRRGRVLSHEHEPWKALDRMDGELLSSSEPLLVLHLGPYDV